MQPTLCSRCKKNVAVVFISKMEGDKTTNEGLCLKCAKELGLPQVDDMMKRMGISDEDLDTLNSEMLQAMSGVENIEDLPGGEDAGEEEEEGKTATFPFLNRLFSGEAAKGGESGGQEESGARSREKERKDPKNGKRKYLENYCISLTQKAADGKLDKIIGVVKAYSSCVGEGPFTCEWFGEEAEKLREAGGEYGAKTGRPRRVGPIDIVATRYGIQCQGATDIALTKLDVLSYMDEIPICARYELNGQETDAFPFPAVLPDAKPVMTAMPGWKCDISGVRKWEDLPEAARNYVEYVEREIGCHITYVSVGPERDSIIIR